MARSFIYLHLCSTLVVLYTDRIYNNQVELGVRLLLVAEKRTRTRLGGGSSSFCLQEYKKHDFRVGINVLNKYKCKQNKYFE